MDARSLAKLLKGANNFTWRRRASTRFHDRDGSDEVTETRGLHCIARERQHQRRAGVDAVARAAAVDGPFDSPRRDGGDAAMIYDDCSLGATSDDEGWRAGVTAESLMVERDVQTVAGILGLFAIELQQDGAEAFGARAGIDPDGLTRLRLRGFGDGLAQARSHSATDVDLGLVGNDDDVECRREGAKAADQFGVDFGRQIARRNIIDARQILDAGAIVDQLGVGKGGATRLDDQRVMLDAAGLERAAQFEAVAVLANHAQRCDAARSQSGEV